MTGSNSPISVSDSGAPPIDELVGVGLRMRREQRALSVTELAEAAGVEEDQIRLWETGKARIPPHILLNLIEALELDPPWFFETLHDLTAPCGTA
jgi:transcriptional regulator with XRE-family HTH domain